MKVIAVGNQKGGVGKSTMSSTIAAGLAIRGARVVLLDASAQGNSTIAFGLKKQPKIYDLLVRDAQWGDSLIAPKAERYAPPDMNVAGSLYVLSSNLETRQIGDAIDNILLMRERLEELSDEIDYAIIDTAPEPNLFHSAIYLASDWVIFVTECEPDSLDGLQESIAQTMKNNALRDANSIPKLQIAGVIPNMYRSNTDAHDFMLQELTKTYKNKVWQPMPLSTVWVERSIKRQSIFAYAPQHAIAGYAWSIVERVEMIR